MTTKTPGEELLNRLGRNEDWRFAGHDFRQIFVDYYPRVFRYFGHHGLSEEDSRDLAQETMLRVYRSLPSFSGESRLGTWIFQVTANVWKNEVRSRNRQKRDASEIPLDAMGAAEPISHSEEGANPLAGLLAEERGEILQKAMSTLPSQMRRCVELRVNQDLKYREIAELMEVSIDTVKAHLFQARQILRAELASYFKLKDFDL